MTRTVIESKTKTVIIGFDEPFCVIGERINPTGRKKLAAEGISLPIHIGVAGPAKLQTLIKFAISCGVGASLRVLQKRAMDVTKLLLPYEPTEFVAQLAAHKARTPNFGIERVHFFPLGGIKTNAAWVTENGGAAGVPANA